MPTESVYLGSGDWLWLHAVAEREKKTTSQVIAEVIAVFRQTEGGKGARHGRK